MFKDEERFYTPEEAMAEFLADICIYDLIRRSLQPCLPLIRREAGHA